MLNIIKQKIKKFFLLKKIGAPLHIPFLAASCMGIPLAVAIYFNNIKAGLTASLAALIVVYFPLFAPTSERIVTLLACSFTFIISYTIGILFSFNHLVSSIIFGIFAIVVHWLSSYLKLKPPKSFFFIMIAATASCIPHNVHKIPENIGLLALGAIFTSSVAFFYSLIINRNKKSINSGTISILLKKNRYTDFIESVILGLFMFISLELGFLLKINNPYWIPVSCLAVMQGATKSHIWQRVIQRIIGTFIGLGLCWIILLLVKKIWIICLVIVILQFILEILVPRNYAVAVIFITPLTILLTEASNSLINNPNMFMSIRFFNTFLGSFIGAIGGWVIYHEKIHYNAIQRIRKSKKISLFFQKKSSS